MESRVVKVGSWYIPQIYTKYHEKEQWVGIVRGGYHIFGEFRHQQQHCSHWTLWGAKRSLKKYLCKDEVEVVYTENG